MFAASPGLHGVEHPIYDIWLTDCKGPDQTIVNAAPDPPKAADAATAAGRRSARRRSRPRRVRRRTPQPQFQQQPPAHRRLHRSSGRVGCSADCSGIENLRAAGQRDRVARMERSGIREALGADGRVPDCAALRPRLRSDLNRALR